jgi:hypothetical protein
MDSRQQSAGMTKRGSLVLSPECVEGLALSLSKDRRIASLYHDKEGRKKVNTNEGEAYKDSVPQLPDIYRNDKQVGFPIAAGSMMYDAGHMIHDP